MDRARHKPSLRPVRDHIRYIDAAALHKAMVARDILPRLVIRGESARSPEGTVPRGETLDVLNRALEEFGKVLIWDLDGIERNRPNLRLVRHFEGEGLWVDAGARGTEAVIDVLIAGAERAVIGTKTFRSLEEIEAARELTDNLAFLVDFAYGKVWGQGEFATLPPSLLLRRATDVGIEVGLAVDEGFAIPSSFLREAPDTLALFTGVVPRSAMASLPSRVGAIVDIWEVVPRMT